MEEIDRISHNASPDIPKLPIKTYRWEDVKRSRKRGAYPWTHLTKPPFDGEVDPEEYTMDAFRRSRSTSTLGKSETQEAADVEMCEKSEDDENLADKENVNDINIQTASVSAETLEVPVSTVHGNGSRDRAKSAEPYKKRKLSVDSSYSRISLPKLRIMDKLKTAKSKLKVPKFPKRSRSEESALKDVKKQKITSSNSEKKQKLQTIKDESPVYIHIPLKLPPGETDEYSKYELESAKQSPSGSLTNVSPPVEKKRKMSLLGLLTQIKLAHDQHVARRSSQTSEEFKKPSKLKSDSDSDVHIEELTEEPQTASDQEESVRPAVEIEESTELEDFMGSDKVVIEELADDEKKLDMCEPEVQEQTEDSSADDNISQYLDKDDKCEVQDAGEPSTVKVQEKQETSEQVPDPEKLRKLEATLSKWKKQTPTQVNLELPARETLPVRARSEEPKRKRRSSIDSSHSRKSLSKLAFIKKIKQAKEKIKFPSFSRFDKKSKPQKENTEIAEKSTQKLKKSQPTQSEKPVYIHIPLKLPPGESDEFSHLESQIVEEIRPIKNKEEEEVKEAETPDSDLHGSNIQLIILTPPSDDEILDSAGPETPCETDQKFFGILKIEDLKTLAKNAVDSVYPDSKVLETVSEAEDNQEIDDEHDVEEQKGILQLKHQILVDEEDGLKLSEVAISMINEELEKEYKQQALGLKSIIKAETSPVLKKKVSFKRKSKTENGGPIYEDVQLSKPDGKTPDDSVVPHSVVIPLESIQSMSVDEEKSYLDKQIMKTTSLEDDYNKWSKLNDHEYEPINPPPEVVSIRAPPVIHDGTRSLERNMQPSYDNTIIPHDERKSNQNLAVHELEKNFEDRYFPNKSNDAEKQKEHFAALPGTVSKTDSLQHNSKGSTSSKASAGSKRRNDSISKSFNNALRAQAVKIKTKIQGIKRPKITLPSPPKLPTAKFKKPSFKKPNMKLPKLPDSSSINLPSFNFTRKDSKETWRARQFSTESNVGDSKKKIFDFRTYPRMFDRSKGRDKASSENNEQSSSQPTFATVPRISKVKTTSKWGDIKKEMSKSPDVIRIPLHSQHSMDAPSNTEFDSNTNEDETEQNQEAEYLRQNEEYNEDNREEEFNHDRPEEEEEEYMNENQEEDSMLSKELLKRWEHGEFHEGPQTGRYIEDIHNVDYSPPPEQEREDLQTPQEGSMEITPPKEHSSGSLSEHRRGVLEEIDSDEFFLREKGISQEDIEVGKYLSSEIRDAFRKPISALPKSHSEDIEYDMELSDQSEPVREPPRRKPLRKPKRKKTPHVSSEQLSFDRESYNTEPEEYPKDFKQVDLENLPPVRPNRRSNSRKKEKAKTVDVIPFQETIPISEQVDGFIHPDYIIAMDNTEILRDNILGNNMQFFYENDFPPMYENECMKDFEQPKIKVYDPYNEYEGVRQSDCHPPVPPARRQRSLRSLSPSDQGSIVDEEKQIPLENVQNYREDREYIIPTPEPPERPRRTRSSTRSISQLEDDRTSRGADSLVSDNQEEVKEVIEEVCIKDTRDASGYAVIDKTKTREPPLPPSRLPKTPPRTRRGNKNKARSDKFATVPRPRNEIVTPVRPLRNYSTLRGTSSTSNEDEKENVNVIHLQSGEVVQKMRDRPLPAPPRPPRKSRSTLRDISHERNLPTNSNENLDKLSTAEDQIEIDDLRQLEDQILSYDHEETITHGSLVLQTLRDSDAISHSTLTTDDKATVHVIEITREPLNEDDKFSEVPDEFKNLKSPPDVLPPSDEAEIPQEPLDEDSEIPPDFHELKSPEIEEPEETSAIPEEFSQLKDPSVQQPKPVESVGIIHDDQEVRILRAQKLQVADLDVDKLHVNELQASKIIVSELDGISLQVSEINSKCGNLIVSGIDLPPNLIQEMLQKLQMAAEEHIASTTVQQSSSGVKPEEENVIPGEKKTSFEEQTLEVEMFDTAPPVPPRHDSKTDLLEVNDEKLEETEEEVVGEIVEGVSEELLEPPLRPPRRSSQVEKVAESIDEAEIFTNVEQNMGNVEILEERLIQELIDGASVSEKNQECTLLNDVDVTNDSISVKNLENDDKNEDSTSKEVLKQETNAESDIQQIDVEQEKLSKSEEEPPPRPPDPVQPELAYIPSQPPPSFYALRSPHFKEFIDEDIPLPPRRKRHHKPPPPVTASSSEDAVPVSRRHHRSPELSIPQLTGQLVRLCALEGDRSIRRLITHITNNIINNVDGKQDLHVVILLLLIFIAGLILLSEPKVTIYQSHWDFFNPPTDL